MLLFFAFIMFWRLLFAIFDCWYLMKDKELLRSKWKMGENQFAIWTSQITMQVNWMCGFSLVKRTKEGYFSIIWINQWTTTICDEYTGAFELLASYFSFIFNIWSIFLRVFSFATVFVNILSYSYSSLCKNRIITDSTSLLLSSKENKLCDPMDHEIELQTIQSPLIISDWS